MGSLSLSGQRATHTTQFKHEGIHNIIGCFTFGSGQHWIICQNLRAWSKLLIQSWRSCSLCITPRPPRGSPRTSPRTSSRSRTLQTSSHTCLQTSTCTCLPPRTCTCLPPKTRTCLPPKTCSLSPSTCPPCSSPPCSSPPCSPPCSPPWLCSS